MTHKPGFTFFGDLLGVAAAYRLSPRRAYEKLNDFYNTVFSSLSGYCQRHVDHVTVNCFSDSVLVWGADRKGILEHLQKVYIQLFRKGMLLRGAIVDGRLEKDPRLELENFRKFLPTDDTLARAVGLEKNEKGARLLVSPALAESVLADSPEWLTVEGYMHHPHPEIAVDDILRRLCPLPSGSSHELLWFWTPSHGGDRDQWNCDEASAKLNEIAQFLEGDASDHYRETAKLLKRCQLRAARTERRLPAV